MAPIGRGIVVLDWNGGGLDAVLCTDDGRPTARKMSDTPLSSVASGAHESHVTTITAAWHEQTGPLLIVAPGMIGSRNGWIEMPYVATPAGVPEIAAGTRRLTLSTGDDVVFLPGLSCRATLPFPDVMRGEETEILGADISDVSRIVLPGGHTKWAEVADGRIVRFQTFVTGELIAAILGTPSLRAARTPPARDWAAFDRGLADAADMSDGGGGPGLLSRLFCARTGWLAGAVSDLSLPDYVAGLVTSAEIEDARRQHWMKSGERIGVIGIESEVEPYRRALEAYGVTAVIASPGPRLRGAVRIAANIH